MIRLEQQPFLERHVETALHRLEREPNGEGRVLEDCAHHLLGGRHELVRGNHLAYETDAQRLLRVNGLLERKGRRLLHATEMAKSVTTSRQDDGNMVEFLLRAGWYISHGITDSGAVRGIGI